MTNGEARAVLSEMLISKTYEDEVQKSKKVQKVINEQCQALNIAIEAIEKQIPKKTLPEKRYYGHGRCPSCNAVFTDKTTNYCGNCGQAIDWSGANG